MKRIELPLTNKIIKTLKAGDDVLLSGTVYTARDAAHRRLVSRLRKRRKTPFPLKGITLYYTGPAPAPPRKVIGSSGPTTSARMDVYTPMLLKRGVKAMIGKGRRSEEVVKAIKKHKAVYFIAPAGCGALLSKQILRRRLLAYEKLGPEAVYELEIRDFPAIVGVDSRGKGVFKGM